jgi:hypothetical protein
MRRAVVFALPILITTTLGMACGGARHITLPTGQGTPVADYASTFAAATARCRDVRTLQADLTLSGRSGRQRLRGRVLAGLIPGALRLEAVSPFGSPVFILVADGARGRLLLPRDRRVLDGASAEDILEALAGVPLAPDDLRALLSGCVKASAEPTGGRAYGTTWMALDLDGGGTIYLRREPPGEWRVVAGGYAGLDVEYGPPANGMPAWVQIRRAATAGRADVSVGVDLSQVEVNGDLPHDQLVALTVPPGTSSITLEELRESGPLSAR